MARDEEYDAFLSYSRRDVAFASALHRNLTALGGRVFFDRQVHVDFQQAWPDLERYLERCRAFLLVQSVSSMASPWTLSELNKYKLLRRKRRARVDVVLARLETCLIPSSLTRQRKTVVDFEQEGAEAHAGALAELGGALGLRTPEPPFPPPPRLQALPADVRLRILELLSQRLRVPATRVGLLELMQIPSFATAAAAGAADAPVDHRLLANRVFARIAASRTEPDAGLEVLDALVQYCGARSRELERLRHVCEQRRLTDEDKELMSSVGSLLQDRYYVHGVLGGRTSLVYRATNLELNREVAIKVRRPARAADQDEEGRRQESFRRLVVSAASVQHPSLVPIHGARFDSRVQLCITDIVPGPSAAELVEFDVRLPVEAALHVTLRVGEVLGHLHAQDMVHLGLSPRSVLVTRDGRVHVSSFGAAAQGESALYQSEVMAVRRATEADLPAAEVRRPTALSDQLVLARIVLGLLEPDASGPLADDVRAVLRRMAATDPGRRFATIEEANERLLAAADALPGARSGLRERALAQFGEALDAVSARTRALERASQSAQAWLEECDPERWIGGFYARFFAADPEVARLFARQPSRARSAEQAAELQRDKLLESLRVVSRFGSLIQYQPVALEALRRRHEHQLGVPPRLYATFARCLLRSLRCELLRSGTPRERRHEVLRAWIALLARVRGFFGRAPLSRPWIGVALGGAATTGTRG